jgi:hypothetical protein
MQASPRDQGEGIPAPVEQVGVRPPVGSAHPAPELVELSQPERVGPGDEHGVRVGDVEAGLDDGGAHQDVELARVEVEHDPLQHALGHLAMTDGHPGARDQTAHPGRGPLDGLDPVVDVEHLPAAVDLAQDGVAHQPVVVLGDAGQNRQARLGRGLDDGHVADAHQ